MTSIPNGKKTSCHPPFTTIKNIKGELKKVKALEAAHWQPLTARQNRRVLRRATRRCQLTPSNQRRKINVGRAEKAARHHYRSASDCVKFDGEISDQGQRRKENRISGALMGRRFFRYTELKPPTRRLSPSGRRLKVFLGDAILRDVPEECR